MPPIRNEVMFDYAPGSKERAELLSAIADLRNQWHSPMQVPAVIDGKDWHASTSKSAAIAHQKICTDHSKSVCTFHQIEDPQLLKKAIDGAVKARRHWADLSQTDRSAVFLRAAELLSQNKNRHQIMAATIIGQGKSIWQAEIEAAAELVDFWRFNCLFAAQLHAQQPSEHFAGNWNRMDYSALEGFVTAISPFNFTAIGGNLASAPALMGNGVLWKPSSSAVFSNYLVYRLLQEAGLPAGVIQFVPSKPKVFTEVCFDDHRLAGVHFTGSTKVFEGIWQSVAANISKYDMFPRLVGETGGKNFHLVHESADLVNVVNQTLRGAFEYQGQKCSAASRLFVPQSVWKTCRAQLVAGIEEIIQQQKERSSTPEFMFCGAVINEAAFAKITGFIQRAKKSKTCRVVVGGESDNSVGYFIQPTMIETTDLMAETMREEIFGPVITVYVYDDYENIVRHLADTNRYGLTGAVFAKDPQIIQWTSGQLKTAAGNFYINDKCTGAVVGQQPFGGGRKSGTNDKAGSMTNLQRWVNARVIKDNLVSLPHWSYPSLKLC